MTTQIDPEHNHIDPHLMTGQTSLHVVSSEDSCTQASLHTEVAQPFYTLVQAAKKAGFCLSIASNEVMLSHTDQDYYATKKELLASDESNF